MNKPNEQPVSFKGNKISLTMHPFYTGKGNNYPTYELTLKLNNSEMVELRKALANKNTSIVSKLLDGALIDIGAPIDI
jgi:hypothetical protein